MSRPPSFGSLETALTAGGLDPGGREIADPVFRLAVLGDFSGPGQGQVSEADVAARRPVEVDRDSFDEVMARVAPSLTLPVPGAEGASFSISFAELDHFHPDHLVESLEIFVELRALRRRLLNPTTFDQAAAELGGWAEPPRAPEAREEQGAAGADRGAEAPGMEVDDLLAASLAATGETGSSAQASSGEALAESLIAQIVGPYVQPAPDPRQDELVAAVDSAISHQMRGVLHHPDFQALEAAWRGLYLLVRRLETGRSLKLSLIDISKAELSGDLMAGDQLARSGLYKLLVERTVATPGGQAWSALAGLYSFEPVLEEIELLGRIGTIAQAAGAAFLAGASPRLAGCAAFDRTPDPGDWHQPLAGEAEQAWQALRATPQAAVLGLVQPRLLLRAPYGKKSDPIEAFAFEEMADGQGHDGYLWGNPAFAAAYLIADGFTAAGWGLRQAVAGEIGGLPVHVYDDAGEATVKPCAEILLTERGGVKISERGIMALWSVRGGDRVQLNPLKSLSSSIPDLQGPWAES